MILGKMVSAEDVISIYKRLSTNGIQVWLTGGWGIDALLGEQTRSHMDIDVIILLDDVPRVCELLGRDGYKIKEFWSENRWVIDAHGNRIETAFVLQDSEGREFDAHAIYLDEHGNGVPVWDEVGDFIFKQGDLAGLGTIARFAIQCITPASQMLCHAGYQLPEKQLRDLELLHEKFGVAYPDSYIGE
jgi:lincosamide nucleotidyltransferase A/C/D/E